MVKCDRYISNTGYQPHDRPINHKNRDRHSTKNQIAIAPLKTKNTTIAPSTPKHHDRNFTKSNSDRPFTTSTSRLTLPKNQTAISIEIQLHLDL